MVVAPGGSIRRKCWARSREDAPSHVVGIAALIDGAITLERDNDETFDATRLVDGVSAGARVDPVKRDGNERP
jgi:hypothetical protein